MRIVLDGVFNHMSSDSPFFDRYHHYATVGACESADLALPQLVHLPRCARGHRHVRGQRGRRTRPPTTAGSASTASRCSTSRIPAVQQYFLTGPNSVSRYWLKQGASGWRLDVMGDSSFPDGYWETFRSVVKATKPDALIISETWQKDSTLLRMLRGDRADTTMNYRLRDAVIGLLAPGTVRLQGLCRQRPHHLAVRVRRPAGLDPRGLPGRGLLLADEPARQPRHRAPAAGR